MSETERLERLLREKDLKIDVLKAKANALSFCLFLVLILVIYLEWPL